jgi:hypothetical protein
MGFVWGLNIKFIFIILFIMPITPLTQDELDWLDLTISNGAVISASITTPDPIPTEINMVNLWDSNTECSVLWFPHENRYSDLFWSSNETVTTINKWLTSLATSDIIANLSNTLYPNKSATKRNIATVLVWTNDFAYWKSVATVWNDYQTLISNIKNDWRELVIFTYPIKLWDTTRNNLIRELNTLIRDNATSLWYEVADIHNDFISDTDIDQNKDWLTREDWLHFTEYWHNIILNNLQAMFKLWIIDYTTWPTNWLLNNLVSYYKCDNIGSFPDAHWSNTWTIYWAAYTASWKINWAYSYDWIDDYVDIWLAWFPSGSTNRTINLWFNPTTLDSADEYIFDYWDTNLRERFSIVVSSSYIWLSFSGWFKKMSATLSTWTQYMITVELDWTTINDTNIYLDNVLLTSLNAILNWTATIGTVLTTWNIWRYIWDSLYSNWVIDEIAVYNDLLSVDQKAAIYNSWSWLSYDSFTT